MRGFSFAGLRFSVTDAGARMVPVSPKHPLPHHPRFCRRFPSARALPSGVVGPVDRPPWNLHLRLPGSLLAWHGCPSRWRLAPHWTRRAALPDSYAPAQSRLAGLRLFSVVDLECIHGIYSHYAMAFVHRCTVGLGIALPALRRKHQGQLPTRLVVRPVVGCGVALDRAVRPAGRPCSRPAVYAVHP